jgi:hypothetical protein
MPADADSATAEQPCARRGRVSHERRIDALLAASIRLSRRTTWQPQPLDTARGYPQASAQSLPRDMPLSDTSEQSLRPSGERRAGRDKPLKLVNLIGSVIRTPGRPIVTVPYSIRVAAT